MAETLKWFEDPAELRRIRKRSGLTQTELANKAGVKRSLIANIEAGRRRLTKDAGNPIWQTLTDIERQLRFRSKTMRLSALAGSGFDSQEELRYELLYPEVDLKDVIAGLKTKIRIKDEMLANDEKIIKLKDAQLAEQGEQSKKQLKRNEDLEKQVKDLKLRNGVLQDLLGLETDAALARDKADEHREQIKKAVTAPEGDE